MSPKVILLALLLTATAHAVPEQVVTIQDGNMNRVNTLLADGWTVKHQSVAVAIAIHELQKEVKLIFVFTMSPPPPEVLAAAEEKRKAEFAKRREEYLKQKQQKEQVEKP